LGSGRAAICYCWRSVAAGARLDCAQQARLAKQTGRLLRLSSGRKTVFGGETLSGAQKRRATGGERAQFCAKFGKFGSHFGRFRLMLEIARSQMPIAAQRRPIAHSLRGAVRARPLCRRAKMFNYVLIPASQLGAHLPPEAKRRPPGRHEDAMRTPRGGRSTQSPLRRATTTGGGEQVAPDAAGAQWGASLGAALE